MSSTSSNLPNAKIHKNDNMNLRISSPNLSSQHSCITIISVNPKPDTICAHLVSSTPKTYKELNIHVKNLSCLFEMKSPPLKCIAWNWFVNWMDFFFLLCWLFSKTVSCSHAGHPLLPRASYPNVHLRLWCRERFHWLSPWCLTFETQMRLRTILFIRPKMSIMFHFLWRSLTTYNWLAGFSLRWWKRI